MEKKLELFDFIKLLFKTSDNRTWNELSSYEKSKFQFMLNRFMSIKYPFNANQINQLKTNGVGVAETWRSVAERFYGDKVPSFIYTKTDKTKKQESALSKIPKESIDIWCEKHECGDKEFNDMLLFNEKELLEELKYITDNYKEQKE